MWYWLEPCNEIRKKKDRSKSYIKNWPEKFSDLLLSWMQMQGKLTQSSGSHRTESGSQVKARDLSLNTSRWVGGWGSLGTTLKAFSKTALERSHGKHLLTAPVQISFGKETFSCYWACANPCPWWILSSVKCVVAQIPGHWHICYVKCRSSGISRARHVPGHRENKCLSGGTVTVSPELLLGIKHLSLGWKRILAWCKAALVDLAAARHFITLQ